MISGVAGILAAGLAWVANVLVVKQWGNKGVVLAVPILEEAFKTGLAVVMGASVLLVHGIFGLIEALHDFSSSRLGLWSGLVSLSSHMLFGLTTFLVFRYTGSWFVGVAAAVLLHAALNYLLMTRHFVRR